MVVMVVGRDVRVVVVIEGCQVGQESEKFKVVQGDMF